MSATTFPVSITPEAAARVAELGMQAELERMLEHTRQTVPGLPLKSSSRGPTTPGTRLLW